MAGLIQRTELIPKLAQIKRREEWLKACEILGLRICRGSKHPETIRRPDMPNDRGQASLITVIPTGLHKGMNTAIFKEILQKSGKTEDEIWKALDIKIK